MPLGLETLVLVLVLGDGDGDDDGSGSGERLVRRRDGRGMSRAKLPVAFPVASLVLLRAIEHDLAARAPRQLLGLVADRANHLRTPLHTKFVAECLRTTDYRSGHVFNIHSNAAAAIADDISFARNEERGTRNEKSEESLFLFFSRAAYALAYDLLYLVNLVITTGSRRSRRSRFPLQSDSRLRRWIALSFPLPAATASCQRPPRPHRTSDPSSAATGPLSTQIPIESSIRHFRIYGNSKKNCENYTIYNVKAAENKEPIINMSITVIS